MYCKEECVTAITVHCINRTKQTGKQSPSIYKQWGFCAGQESTKAAHLQMAFQSNSSASISENGVVHILPRGSLLPFTLQRLGRAFLLIMLWVTRTFPSISQSPRGSLLHSVRYWSLLPPMQSLFPIEYGVGHSPNDRTGLLLPLRNFATPESTLGAMPCVTRPLR